MSGHSKFSNIKHRKERNDSAKGKIFTRLGREIAVAVKSGGADPSANGKLRDIIAKAKAGNMPNDTIDRSIKKAAGDLNAVNYESITYEGYGPSGVAVIVKALTDNRNRAAANIRSAFTKGGGNMGATGCVSFLFDEKGLIVLSREDGEVDEDELMMLALEAGAEDFSVEEETYEILTPADNFGAVREAVENAHLPAEIISAEVTLIPQTYTSLNNHDDQKKMRKLLDMLDEEDDVIDVYHNWENETE
ncbi:MAG: YebC/PmpR family DNA-binding transcriptional regulator [Clostridiales bacterium]|jgi:YebC/PmpR family DNA-binding regulatory protein|nr:YebC/PmpR family DNA-binding transcriptional regulator [Clostridiales bacterium]